MKQRKHSLNIWSNGVTKCVSNGTAFGLLMDLNDEAIQ